MKGSCAHDNVSSRASKFGSLLPFQQGPCFTEVLITGLKWKMKLFA